MPDIPALSLTSDNVNIQEVYEDGIYNPTVATPDTFDILNGGMDNLNLASGTDFVPVVAIQPGSFASGGYFPFERWEFVYGTQLSQDDNDKNRVVLAGLSIKLFKPFDCSFILFGYQATCRQDAGAYSTGGSIDAANVELWKLYCRVDSTAVFGATATLPHGRATEHFGEDDSDSNHDERRWRYVSKIHGLRRGVDADSLLDKGYISLKVQVWAKIDELDDIADPYKAKLIVPSGGIWMLALR